MTMTPQTGHAQELFYNTQQLAQRLFCSRFTICRWRLIGFLPQPAYCDGRTSLWFRSDIEDWVHSGEWSNPKLAQAALEYHGAEKFQEFKKRQPPKPETKEVAEIVDDFERQLNEFSLTGEDCDLVTRRLEDVQQLVSERRQIAEGDQGDE